MCFLWGGDGNESGNKIDLFYFPLLQLPIRTHFVLLIILFNIENYFWVHHQVKHKEQLSTFQFQPFPSHLWNNSENGLDLSKQRPRTNRTTRQSGLSAGEACLFVQHLPSPFSSLRAAILWFLFLFFFRVALDSIVWVQMLWERWGKSHRGWSQWCHWTRGRSFTLSAMFFLKDLHMWESCQEGWLPKEGQQPWPLIQTLVLLEHRPCIEEGEHRVSIVGC